MKFLVAFGLSSIAAAQLRHWPWWHPKIPPWIDLHIVPGREYNGLTDPAKNFHIGQDCSVQYEKRVFKGTCQKDDDFGKSAFGGCPTDVSLYGCGSDHTSNLLSYFHSYVLQSRSFSTFGSDWLTDKIMNDRGRPQLNAVLCQSALWKRLREKFL